MFFVLWLAFYLLYDKGFQVLHYGYKAIDIIQIISSLLTIIYLCLLQTLK